MNGEQQDHREGPAGSSLGERALGILGGLVTLSLLGFLAYQAMAVRDGGPRLGVEIVTVQETPSGFVAEVRVRNDGGGTAQAVHLLGTVTVGGRPVEESTATIDYIAPGSSAKAALVFGVKPSTGDLDVRVAGYALP